MPKYKLDDKGILTITNEHDGSVFTVRDVLKKATTVVFILSIVLCAVTYMFFYYDSPDTGFANKYCSDCIGEFNCVSQFDSIIENYSTVYDGDSVKKVSNVQCNFYLTTIEEIYSKSVSLIGRIHNQIETLGEKWR